jgi:hypothetical protein
LRLSFTAEVEFLTTYFPVAEQTCESEAIWLDESIFYLRKKGVDDVILALENILDNADKRAQVVLMLDNE